MYENISTIIWDWNGTLLNDRQLSIDAVNVLLEKRKIPLISEEIYFDSFGFPVKKYYERIGFDFSKEPFEVPAIEFIETYYSNIKNAELHINSINALNVFAKMGYKQFILSAAEHTKLLELLAFFRIEHFFHSVSGLTHDYATSKIEMGRTLLLDHQIEAGNACLIGDTDHDYEVAEALGCRCILIANGHQPKRKLLQSGCLVIDNIEQLTKIFSKNQNL
jgi:phosphoglycolate phosphatase